MKPLKIFLILATLTTPALAGNDGPGAGDMYAYEFTWLAKSVAKHLTTKDFSDAKIETTPKELLETISQTRVYSKEKVYIDSFEVDAANYSKSKKIELNRQRWRNSNIYQRSKLAIHEFLGILSLEWNHYDLSHPLSKKIEQALDRAIASGEVDLPHIHYGYCSKTPALEERDYCEPLTRQANELKACAISMAMKRCEMQSKGCQIYEVIVQPVLDRRMPLIQHCTAEAIVQGR
ncbi:MAG: hypothetical protein IPM57_10375 [Oligoflexia bacterium]|nr:hypothetical protein [Oligoflexia bacterium]